MVLNWLLDPKHFAITTTGDHAGNSDDNWWGLPSIEAQDPAFPKYVTVQPTHLRSYTHSRATQMIHHSRNSQYSCTPLADHLTHQRSVLWCAIVLYEQAWVLARIRMGAFYGMIVQ